MNETDKVELQIEVSAKDTTEEDIDRLTRQLLFELRETDIESAELSITGAAPPGAKSGDTVAMGSILISTLPTVLPAVVSLVQTWIERGQGRVVKFKGKIGKEMVEFEGPPEELRRLLETMNKGKSKR